MIAGDWTGIVSTTAGYSTTWPIFGTLIKAPHPARKRQPWRDDVDFRLPQIKGKAQAVVDAVMPLRVGKRPWTGKQFRKL